MKNKTLLIAGTILAAVLAAAFIYKNKISAKKQNTEPDYDSPEYEASLQRKIEIAMGMHESEEKNKEQANEIPVSEWEDMW